MNPVAEPKFPGQEHSPLTVNPYLVRLEALLKRDAEIPAIPITALKLNQAIQNQNTNFKEIEDIIQLDPSLTGKIYSLARSAFYSRGSKVGSISEAIGRIGLQNVRRAALSMEIVKSLQISFDQKVDWNAFWFHSVLTAHISEIIDQAYIKGDQVSNGYLAGLLHDVGKLFLAKHFREETAFMLNLTANAYHTIWKVEEENLGFNHGYVSAAFCEKWGLAREVVTAVRCHHSPLTRLADRPPLACIINVADTLANMTGINLATPGIDWDEFEEQPAWIKLKEIGPVSPLDLDIEKIIENTKRVVNATAGETVA